MPIPAIRRNSCASAPLSVQQRNIWLEHEMYPGNISYNIVYCLHLAGCLDVEAFKRSLAEIVRRHEMLRTTFSAMESEPRQAIHPQMEVSVPETALDMFSQEEQLSEVRRMAYVEITSPFDLERGPLFRFALMALNKDEHVFLMTVHHLVMDGWSVGLFTHELTTLYDAFRDGRPSPLPEIGVQYSDYALWQNERGKSRREQDGRYWDEVMKDSTFGEFPTDHPRVFGRKGGSATQTAEFPADLTGKMKSFSRGERATLFVTALAGFQLLLHRYTGQDNILAGCYTAGRDHGEIQHLLGHFSGLVAVRTEFSGDPDFREVVRRTRRSLFDARAHENVLVSDFSRHMDDAGGSTFFPVVFNFHNYPNHPGKPSGLNIGLMPLVTDSVRFDMEVTFAVFQEKLSVTVQYNRDIYSEDTVKRTLDYYKNVMASVMDDPDQPTGKISVMSPAETRRVVEEWNSEKADYPTDATIHRLIDAAAKENPDAVALIYDDHETTYRELAALSNHAARRLAEMGVGPEVMVGVCMERSHSLIVALLAVLKAGGVYVPLDPIYPDEKLAYMLQNSTAPVLLTEQGQMAKFSGYTGKKVDVASLLARSDADKATHNLPSVNVGSENSAYLIYTSGSTGKPKGVLVSHRNVVNSFCFMDAHMEDAAASRVWLFSTSVCFDPSVLEMFWTLSRGYQVVVLPNESSGRFLNVDAIPELIDRHHVSHFQCTPSVLGMLFDRVDGVTALKQLAKLMVGGECLPVPLAERLSTETSADVYNVYGPTETTLWATCHRLRKDDNNNGGVPIGRPLPNYEVYILDRDLQPVPIGAYGEVYIGGDGVAKGYFNAPELTARKYIPNPFSHQSGARMYQTGDIARYRADGVIEFLGRADRQVKIRGHRIELGEIEAAILSCARIREAVVVTSGTDINQRLLGYVIPDFESDNTEDRDSYIKELKEALSRKLPEFMIPASLTALTEFPKLSNGKIDRKSLPIPEIFTGDADKSNNAISPVESRLMEIWKEMLEFGGFGINDHYVDIGGNSLSAVMILNRIKSEWSINISIRDFLDNPTIRLLAKLVEDRMGNDVPESSDRIRPIDRNGDLPLSIFQENRLRYELNLEVRNIPYLPASAWFSLRLSGNLDRKALEGAFDYMINRHEVFRTALWPVLGSVSPATDKWNTICQTCRMNPGLFLPKVQFKQSICSSATMDLSYHDVSKYSDEDKYIEINVLADEIIQKRYDYEIPPLTRAALIRTGEIEHILIVAASHLIADAVSMHIYEKELAYAYNALVNKHPINLPDIEIQYVDYAAWQRHQLESGAFDPVKSYWARQLDGYTPTDATILPFADIDGSKDDEDFDLEAKYYYHPISDDLSMAIHKYAASVNMTPFNIIMTAFILCLHHESGKDDIGMFTFFANRTRSEIENTIGMFANGNTIRVKINTNNSLYQCVMDVSENLGGALNNQELMVDPLDPRAMKSLCDMVAYRPITCELLADHECASFSGLNVGKAIIGRSKSEYALRLFVIDSNERLSLMFQYNLDLFDVINIKRLTEYAEDIMQKIASNYSAIIPDIT
jgi:amino acid adenylation domain-containing protein